VIEEKLGASVPYYGVLGRKSDDVAAFSAAVGAVWANVGGAKLTFGGLDAAFATNSLDKPQFLRSMPGYTWDHNQVFWAESRLSKAMRSRKQGPHELLGVRLDSGEDELRWRNFLKPSEMPWVHGHQIQGQTIFPGAGFAAMAIEAAKAFADDAGEEVELIELEDLTIRRALAFVDEILGAEVIVTLSNVQRSANGLVLLDFVCGACPSKDAAPTTISAARIKLRLGPGSPDTLPPRDRSSEDEKMTDVDTEIFYNSLAKLGYNYTDMFKGITKLSRRRQASSGIINTAGDEGYNTDLIVHPAPLDVAFQAMFGAIGAPGDGQLWTLMVPTVIRSIKVNPLMCKQTACLGTDLSFDAGVEVERSSQQIFGDMDVYDESGNALLQIEGLEVTPVTQITAKDDAQKFSETVWAPEKVDATRGFTEFWQGQTEECEKSFFFERSCFYYMKRLHEAISAEEREGLAAQPKKYLNWVSSVVEAAIAGTHPTIQKEWLDDTSETMDDRMKEFAREYDDFYYLTTLGDSLIPFIRGEVSLEDLFHDSDVLGDIYKHTYGVAEYTDYLGGVVEQLAHKYKQLEILEVGAGTGSATEAIMSRLGDHFGSYTYTDISASFFPAAQKLFKAQEEKFMYKPFDVEGDVTEQGFTGRYDLIVASSVVQATKSIETTLTNLRKLLKPGGYLVLSEITDVDSMRQPFFGSLPGLWDGEEDYPLLSRSGWDAALKKTGFSGIDTATPETGVSILPLSVMFTQAVDTQMQLIRQPLNPEYSNDSIKLPKLLLIAGKDTAEVQENILAALSPFSTEVQVVSRFEDLEESHFGPKQFVLSLMELDTTAFQPFTAARWKAVQLLAEKSLNILWLTRGGGGENPFSNMMPAVGRCLVHEKPDLQFQFVDFEVNAPVDTEYVASTLMRMHIYASWKAKAEPYAALWVLEREIRLVDGQVIISRQIPCRTLDAPYNSSRRTVRKEVALEDSVVAVGTKSGAYELREVRTPSWAVQPRADVIEIQTLQSTLSAVTIPSVGSLYLIVGKIVGSEQTVLALSENLQSKVSVSQDMALPVDLGEDQATELLVSAASYLLGDYLVSHTGKNTSLMVHEPPTVLAAALKDLARDRHINLSLTTSSPSRTELRYVHPNAHRRTVLGLLPPRLTTFAYFNNADDVAQSGVHLKEHLPSHVRQLSPREFLSDSAYLQPQASSETALKLLQQARAFFETHSGLDATECLQELSLDELPGYKPEHEHFIIEVLNLSEESSAMCALIPSEDQAQFRPDKTYWLCGLTGELGLSLTRWMIERGARYIVLTSRNPKVDEKWLERMQATGATVKLMAM
jgi:2-polyprenyl-3-methyl-5-hydroxy-6-metoxy-1,4-benzoquinol methylase